MSVFHVPVPQALPMVLTDFEGQQKNLSASEHEKTRSRNRFF